MSGRLVNVRPKQGFVLDARGDVVPMRFRDGLSNLVTGLGTRADARTSRAYFANIMTPQQIEEAFEGSAMLRKAVTIPATDRIRAWRDWQADKDQIEALEAEEHKHQLQAKVRQAEILRGLGGGAIILVGPGDTAMPLNVTSKGGLVAVNVVSRWHIQGHDWVEDLSSADYGKPAYWTMSGSQGQTRLHPSRVVCFRAEPLPSVFRGSYEERFWGRGRVPSLLEPAQNLDEALATFSAIIKDALTIDVGISKLLDIVATTEGEAQLMRRLSLMIQGSSIFNGKLYDLGSGDGKDAEKIDRHQVTWQGIPDIIRVYAEAFSAASDIPVTRLWGTSAKGLNATGEGDERDWNKMVETGQALETKPCLDEIDAALIPSALGSRPASVWWQFSPLSIPTEKEETDRFKIWADAMEKVGMSGAIPDEAYNEAYQNGMIEGGWAPGLDNALDKIPEALRYGGTPQPDPNMLDPSALTQKGGDPSLAGNGGAGSPAARAQDAWAIDATPRPLYVRRDLLPASAKALAAWAKKNGFASTLAESDMHVTVLYSKQPVDPMKMGEAWGSEPNGDLIVKRGGPRALERFGEGAVVLQFASWSLVSRHEDMVRAGASHDYEEYLPHVTITYSAPDNLDLSKIVPFDGELHFGPEIFQPLDEDWKSKIEEA
jgi:phage-related protein (TIGR01555 family)